MASADISQYHKYIDLQNVSGSGDPTSAPAGGIYLFASGTAGNAKLYLQNEGVGTPLSLADGGTLAIAGDSGTDTVNLSGDTFTVAGGEGVVSTVTDNQVSLAVSIADFSSELSSATVADTDEFAISDGGTMKKIDFQHVRDSVFADVSGDLAVAAGGAATIQAGAVEHGMLNDNVISGQDELAHANIADADDMLIHDATDNVVKRVGVDSLRDHFFGVVSGDIAVADGGAATIQANAVEGSMINSNAAGDGLGYASNALKVNVSGALAITSDKVGISGSFAGAGLAYSGAVGAIGGLALDIDNLDAMSESLHQTNDHFLVSDAGTEKKITFSNLEDSIFGNISGDVAVAAGGAATIQDNAVESTMLNDNVISGQTELAHADIADADELMISDGGTLKKVGVDSIRDHFFGVVSGDATVADGGALTLAAAQTSITSLLATDIKIGEDNETKIDFETPNEIHFYADNAEQVFVSDGVFGPETDSDVDLGADGVAFKKLFVDDIDLNGQGRIDLDADGDTSIRSAADDQIQLEVGGSDMVTVLATGMGVNGGYGSGNGSSFGADGTGNFDGNLNVGADGSGADFVIYGATANERMMYDASEHVLQFRDSSAATMLTLGGDATSEYALDVANGSNNINKVRAAAFVTYSDESLKSDVKAMNTALDTVMSLNGVEFTWKDSGERDFGFIAQDVQSVLPKAVHVAEDGVQGVDYSRLTSVLVEAVKAQQIQIEELKTLLKK